MSEPKPTARGGGRATAWALGRRVSLLLAAVLGFAVLGGAIWAFRALDALQPGSRIDFDDGIVDAYDPGGPRNVLILGSDTRKGLTKEEQRMFGSEADVPDDRTDTIILMHLDPERDRAVVVHFPRDLRVRIPGEGLDKINAAYDYGGGGEDGAELAIRTVEEFSGLPIHNYIEVSLAGFQDLVDTLGGVRICVDQPMFDELAGLNIPTAGCHRLDGFMSLAFVRARHIEGDTIPDFSRITRQQQFMRALVNEMLSVDSLLDTSLIREAAGQLTTDDQLESTDLIYLASELRKVAETDPSGASLVDFRTVPSVPAPELIDEISYVLPLRAKARELFRRIQEGEPLGTLGKVLTQTEASPANITTRILDAGDASAAAEADEILSGAGFVVLDSSAAPASLRETQLLYAPGSEQLAQVVAGYFPDAPVRQGTPRLLGEADVAVVVARDYRSPLA